MASEVLMNISRSKEERARIMRAEKTELDYQSWMLEAKETGHAEGRAESLAEVAQNLKNMGLSAEQIMKATGLRPEQFQ